MKVKAAIVIPVALMLLGLAAIAQNERSAPDLEQRISQLQNQVSILQARVDRLEANAKPGAKLLRDTYANQPEFSK